MAAARQPSPKPSAKVVPADTSINALFHQIFFVIASLQLRNSLPLPDPSGSGTTGTRRSHSDYVLPTGGSQSVERVTSLKNDPDSTAPRIREKSLLLSLAAPSPKTQNFLDFFFRNRFHKPRVRHDSTNQARRCHIKRWIPAPRPHWNPTASAQLADF